MHIYAPNIEHKHERKHKPTRERENGRTGERKWNREREKKNGRKKYNVLLFDEYMDQKASIALAKASTRLCMPM